MNDFLARKFGQFVRTVESVVSAIVIVGAVGGCGQIDHRVQNPLLVAPDAAATNARLSPEGWDVNLLSSAIFQETNRVRRELGLKPLEPHEALNRAADLQATANALNQTAVHSNIVREWATPADRVRELGLNPAIVSENAALLPLIDIDPDRGYSERDDGGDTVVVDQATGIVASPHTYASFAQRLVHAWMNSPGHRANIVNARFRYLGCSARPTKSVGGLDLITGIQVFFTPVGG
jgi:uncharacterized protein YkwD